MNFVFIHGNYPAQFRSLATLLAHDNRHRVVFITGIDARIEPQINNLEVHKYELHREVSNDTHHYLSKTEEAVLTGQAVIKKLSELLGNGLRPDVIITHSGNGIGLFIKELVPWAVHVGYFEWYFQVGTVKHLVKDLSFDKKLECSMRNLTILQELEKCDIGIVPTKWQKKQFPIEFSNKLRVIFDGIDTNFFKENEVENAKSEIMIQGNERERYVIKENRKILTYATRGMEPLRGFPEFMEAVGLLLEEDKNIEVYIAGSDRIAYSYGPDSHGGSWKKKLLDEVISKKARERIFFTGLLSYGDYRNLLWRSDLHCYFTKPYVTSWSFFEAGALGAYVAANKNEATSDIYVEGTIKWLNIEEPKTMAKQLKEGLYDRKKKKAKLRDGFELNKCLEKWQEELNIAMVKRRTEGERG